MTPEEYVAEISRLASEGRDEDALALGREHVTDTHPQLSATDLAIVQGLLSTSQSVVDLRAMSPDPLES